MGNNPLNLSTVVLLFLVVLLFPTNAHAYIDPSTGAMLLQLLLAGVAGALVVIKLYWKRLKSVFSPMLNRTEAEREDPEE